MSISIVSESRAFPLESYNDEKNTLERKKEYEYDNFLRIRTIDNESQ